MPVQRPQTADCILYVDCVTSGPMSGCTVAQTVPESDVAHSKQQQVSCAPVRLGGFPVHMGPRLHVFDSRYSIPQLLRRCIGCTEQLFMVCADATLQLVSCWGSSSACAHCRSAAAEVWAVVASAVHVASSCLDPANTQQHHCVGFLSCSTPMPPASHASQHTSQ